MENNRDLKLWGGVECTINRVGDRYLNQLQFSGHWQRSDDLERFAQLGLRTLRFPLLWESVAPESPNEIDWSWPDARLAQLQALGIRPIIGLLHHGSGPRYTSLVDPDFPEKFARFAAAVAQRYPWIDAYTPINEPLTTARFSALYGHWYPHATNDNTFVRALFNQCRAVHLAMDAIRNANSGALLVQTEDLGHTFSTPHLSYQADFENERRWMTWDLLCGAVDCEHPLWSYFEWAGANRATLDFFAGAPCPPDMLGINYYVTSERYLDEEIDNYPRELWGNNGRDTYADDAAVRARPEGLAGLGLLLPETFRRYRLPIALTEIHLGCTEDEQLRWFMEMWKAAEASRARGIDVRAVTAWALLGSFDWDSLATNQRGHYEAGAFDLRNGAPRPTLLAAAIKQLARGEPFLHPMLESAGWWKRPSRLRCCAERQGAKAAAR
jgi:dTDP-4-dehydrorhamnose reductase